MQNKQTDENKVLKDGATFRVPLVLMDGVQRTIAHTAQTVSPVGHRPGSLPVADADRQKRVVQRDAANKALSARWKNPPALASEAKQPVKDAPTTDMAAAYAKADAKLRERWRGAA